MIQFQQKYTHVTKYFKASLTCVTSGSKSLSTVRVRISKLLGSHFNMIGEVAEVMLPTETHIIH